jgi:flagellar hook assembly protein FlgD
MQGRINYDLSGLTDGIHYLTVKAWDNFNNSSEKTISFKVMTGNNFIISNLINYPNPFFNETFITLEHNRPDVDLEVRIDIYSIDGRIIRTIKTHVEPTGYTLPPVSWDGNEQGGRKAGRGVYLYIVTIVTSKGESAKATGRLVIL